MFKYWCWAWVDGWMYHFGKQDDKSTVYLNIGYQINDNLSFKLCDFVTLNMP